VSTNGRSRTLNSRGVPKYKPDKFVSVRTELGLDVVGVSIVKLLPPIGGWIIRGCDW
jgi:hypothetical protein